MNFKNLLARAKAQGTLTYEEVSRFLPDETLGTDRIDEVLSALDSLGIELVDGPDAHKRALAEAERPTADGDRAFVLTDGMPAGSSDPIRMYLSQMAEIPLLTRDEEIGLAKKIELTRKRFRRNMLRSFYAMEATVKTLQRVHSGELPFDRTIKVSLTEQLTKEQVQARMPHNLPLLVHLMQAQKSDFALLISRRATADDKAAARTRLPAPPREDARPGRGAQPADPPRAAADAAARGDVAADGRAQAAARRAEVDRRTRPKRSPPSASELRQLMLTHAGKPQQPASPLPPAARASSRSSRTSSASFPAATCGWWCRSPRSTATAACRSWT